jgi:hypothetical protein
MRSSWLAVCCLAAGVVPSGCGRTGPPPPTSRATSDIPRPAPPRSPPISIEWVGDMALSSSLGLPPGGVLGALAPVAEQLRHADLTIGNLEGTLATTPGSKCAGQSSGSCFAFEAPPAYAQQFATVGFDVLNQANNHALDFGEAGRSETLAALAAARVKAAGLPGRITLATAGRERVAVVGFAPYPWASDLRNIVAAKVLVTRARRRARIVVVLMHAGAEGAGELHTPAGTESFLGEDRGDTRAFAHAAVDAGAALVFGSGPHVIRGVERYRRALIAYSLGNFLGYRTLGQGGVLSESAILRVELTPSGRFLRGRWISVELVDGLPRLDGSNSSAHLVASLSHEDFQDSFVFAPSGAIRP